MTNRKRERICLLAGSRTPIGSFGKSLRKLSAADLCKHTILNALRKSGVNPQQVDGVILGQRFQTPEEPNLGRYAWISAGLPDNVPGLTVNRECGSGMESVRLAMMEIWSGNGDIYVAGGADSMTRAPYLLPGSLRFEGPLHKKFKFGPRPVVAQLADDSLVPRKTLGDYKTTHMSGTAQILADKYNVSRKEMDEYGLLSQERTLKAIKNGHFSKEIDPVITESKVIERDEHPRKTTIEKLATLRPNYKTRDITAGNSSGINDGACSLVLASESKAKELGKEVLAYLTDCQVVALSPYEMGLGPVYAIQKVLDRNGLSKDDIDLFEINEAFAAQYIACEKMLGLNRDKVNVDGGAIALGHPIAMSGARLVLSLAHKLKDRGLKRGIASLCIGGGQGIAMLIEAAESSESKNQGKKSDNSVDVNNN